MHTHTVPPPAPVPGSRVTPQYDGAGLSLERGRGRAQSGMGPGQSETDAAMTPASTICAAPLQVRLLPPACQHQSLLGASTAGIKKVTILIPGLPVPSLATR